MFMCLVQEQLAGQLRSGSSRERLPRNMPMQSSVPCRRHSLPETSKGAMIETQKQPSVRLYHNGLRNSYRALAILKALGFQELNREL